MSSPVGRTVTRMLGGFALAGVLSFGYMAFEAQWVRCRQIDLSVPGLPAAWSGLTILHLSDVHAGTFAVNDRSLAKVVRWAEPLAPDLIVLTGDILGDPLKSGRCLDLLARLRPSLGMFAVTGNHEYGLSKAPLARHRETDGLWAEAGATLLSDSCIALPPREGVEFVLCGADHMTGGFGLLDENVLNRIAGPVLCERGSPDNSDETGPDVPFLMLLIHDPSAADPSLPRLFPLTFAGHTHGGQLRVPGLRGLAPFHMSRDEYLGGVHRWGAGLLVVSRGIGTSFLPLRLLTRPEATLWRLVYTSGEQSAQADEPT